MHQFRIPFPKHENCSIHMTQDLLCPPQDRALQDYNDNSLYVSKNQSHHEFDGPSIDTRYVFQLDYRFC